jgi:hypothetical protein
MNIEQFARDNGKNPAQVEALRTHLTFQNSPELRAGFGTYGEYLAQLERPEESPYRVSTEGGRVRVERNTGRRMSPITLKELEAQWADNAQLRCEFGSFDVYKAFISAQVRNLVKIKSAA